MMNAAVIVPTFNRADLVGQAIDSLLKQTVPISQIIVVNDGSTDSTESTLDPFRERVSCMFQNNGGKATAINYALASLKDDIDLIWIFDDDDVAFPDALERHLRALEDDRAGFSYSSYVAAQEDSKKRLLPKHDANTPEIKNESFLSELLIRNFVSHPGFVVRRQIQEKAGPYDERLVRSQDYDMILRIARISDPAWVEGPTYYRRYNSAPRGSRADRFSHLHYEVKAHHYEKVLFEKIFRVMALEEYLPRDAEYDEQSALIARMTVMAIRGLWDRVTQDASRLGGLGPRLSPEMLERLWRVGSRPAAVLDAEVKTVRRLPRLLRAPMAKSFLYAALRDRMPLWMRAKTAIKSLELYAA